MCAYGRVLAEPRLSPDGERIAFVTNVAARGQIVVAPAKGGPEVVVTGDPPPRPVASYGGGAFDWTPDGEALVFAAVDGGLWVTSVEGGLARQLATKQASGGCAAPSISPDGTRVAFVVNQQHVAVAPLDGSAWPTLLSSAADFCFDPSWSPDSTRVVWHEWDIPAMPWDEGRIVVRDAAGARAGEVVAGGAGISVQQPRFSPDGTRLAYLSDETGWLNLWVAAADGSDAKPLVEEDVEHGDPSWGLGQRSYAWSPQGTSIVFTRNRLGFGTVDRVNVATGDVSALDKGVHGGLSWRGDRIAAVRSGARAPTQIVLYEEAGDRRTTVARGPVGGFEALDLPEPIAVTWEADDGAAIHGRLYELCCSPTIAARLVTGARTCSRWPEGGVISTRPTLRPECGRRRGVAGVTAAGWLSWAAPPAGSPCSTSSRIIRTCARPASTCSAWRTCSTSTRRRIASRRTTCTRSSARYPTRRMRTATGRPCPSPIASHRRC
jgi:Tol biopolymer transport system component